MENLKFPESWESAKSEAIKGFIYGSAVSAYRFLNSCTSSAISDYYGAARIMAERYEARIAELETVNNDLARTGNENVSTILSQMARIEELEQRWISIKDSRPVVNEPVLCYSGEGVMSIEKRRQGQNSIYCDQTDSGYATHWMPLPKPPTK